LISQALLEDAASMFLDVRSAMRAMRWPQLAAIVVFPLTVVACSSSGSVASLAAPSVPRSTTVAASPAPETTPNTSPAAAESASPVASGPCVDVGQLADTGDSVENQMDAIKTALAAKKADDARSAAQTAGVGINALADLVGPVSPQAKQAFLSAGTELAKAASQFPSGAAMFDQAQKDFEAAFVVARAAGCAV
jgi:hypothetical protein